jgi:hypothetical protein
VHNYVIRRAEELVMDQGIMSSPHLKPGNTLKTLKEVTVEDNIDKVSKVMPCKTDHILTSVVLKYVNKADYYAV